jgi:hypothetical protein
MSKRGSVQASGDGSNKPGGSGPSGGFSSDGKDLGGSSGGNLPNRPGGGFFTPGRMIGGALGGLALGPIGGILGGILGNQMGRGRYGYTDAEGNRVSAARDMFDGGGPGRYGDRFQGGPFSGLLNAVGARPAGYRARQEAAGPDMGMAEAMAAPAMTGTTPATTVAMPLAPTVPSNAFPGMYASNYMSMRSPSMNPAFTGSGMTPATNYVPMRDPTSPTTGVMPADLAPAYDPRLTPEMQRAMRSMPATGQALAPQADMDGNTGSAAIAPQAAPAEDTPSISRSLFDAIADRPLNPIAESILAGFSEARRRDFIFDRINRPGDLGYERARRLAEGLPPEPTAQVVSTERYTPFNPGQSSRAPGPYDTPYSPFGTRALTPYEQMQARAAGRGITYTQPGSLRPMGR